MPTFLTAAGTRTPLLARLKVGTKLMLLVLLPVCVLLAFTSVTAIADWHSASSLRNFRTATRLSFATAGLADRLATERTAAVLLGLRPGAQAQAALASAQREVNQALRQAGRSAAGWHGTVDVAGRLDAVRRQLGALRLQVAAGSLPLQQVPGSYGVIADNLINTVDDLVAARPAQASDRPADAYLAIMLAVEAAERERVDVAEVLGTPGHDQLLTASRWATLENAELDSFRVEAAPRLSADLKAVLFTPAGITVQQVRDEFLTDPRAAVAHTSVAGWLDASGNRIDGLRSLESGAAGDLAASAAADLRAAETGGIRNLIVSLAVLMIVAALALALRRSITRPLREVSEGARTLSSGNLASGVSYAGRDEIGDVAAAFRELHVTAERLAGEIRATNAAIGGNRLDHRADVSAFEGTWAQLLAGMNDTTAAFAKLHRRRRRAERDLEDMFNLSRDLLCVAGKDGYFKRVNPAFERTLGYSSEELLAKPFTDFVHPDDRAGTQAAQDSLVRGDEITRFENRYIRRDGTVRWLEWNARPVPEEGLIYAAARDVTDSRRAGQEQAALRRVATLVAKGVSPAEVFDAVVAEMHLLLGADNTRLMRYDRESTVTVVASRAEPGMDIPVQTSFPLHGRSVAATVWHTRRAARLDGGFEGPPGSIADQYRRLGIRSAAGAPVLVQDRLWGVMVTAWVSHRPDPGIEDRVAQFTELIATAISNAQARADLAASRARIVAAGDQTRRRIERDLHDGAQQQLVSLRLGLRAAREAVPPDQAELRGELARVADGIAGVLEELRELSRGIHPAVLSVGGLGPALKTLARRSAIPVELAIGVPGRLPERVEVATYFVISEALANAAKHSHASVVRVHVEMEGGLLRVRVSDDGVGGADPASGTGLIGLADRVEALGGTVAVSSQAGAGTSIVARLPLDDSV
jgi:PAS domain S-box-containing protein